MNLAIDIGNTFSKMAVFSDGNITETYRYPEISENITESIFNDYPEIKKTILSSVKNIDPKIIELIKSKSKIFIELSETTKIPIENLYHSKSTLGKDRLASAVGANNIFPNTNVLVIDMGTAITIDFVNDKNQYLGGNISPGLETRFKALNHFTGKLPLLQKKEQFDVLAKNTEDAIISGVQNGIIYELDGYINHLKNNYDDLKVILTGGDAFFFDKKLKNTIFVNSNLNFIGLNIILETNTAQ
ncbi:MAG TPA: type III pantothenate kinase [Bacteroidales bacterium]|nr:type III pantothenate kinase [Bacteroidales bacterium]